MLHATAHDIMLRGMRDLLGPFQIRRETIMLVNERLADPIQSINGVTVEAIACLVLFEVSGKLTH